MRVGLIHMKTTKTFTVNISERLAKIIVLLPLGGYFGYHAWTLIYNLRYDSPGMLDGASSMRLSLLENSLVYLAYDLFLLALFYVYLIKQPKLKRWLLTTTGFITLKFTTTLYEFLWVTFIMHNSMYDTDVDRFMIGRVDSRIILMRLIVIGLTGTALYVYRKKAKSF